MKGRTARRAMLVPTVRGAKWLSRAPATRRVSRAVGRRISVFARRATLVRAARSASFVRQHTTAPEESTRWNARSTRSVRRVHLPSVSVPAFRDSRGQTGRARRAPRVRIAPEATAFFTAQTKPPPTLGPVNVRARQGTGEATPSRAPTAPATSTARATAKKPPVRPIPTVGRMQRRQGSVRAPRDSQVPVGRIVRHAQRIPTALLWAARCATAPRTACHQPGPSEQGSARVKEAITIDAGTRILLPAQTASFATPGPTAQKASRRRARLE